MTDWQRLRREHGAAVARYVETVDALSPEQWEQPVGEGKWSPEEVTIHLVLVFEAVLRELREGVPMALRAPWWLRPVLRLFVLPRLIAGKRFPRARAPREARPRGRIGDRAETVARLRARAAEWEREVERVGTAERRRRLTHPYFGPLPLAQAIRFSASHLEHHRRQVASVLGDRRPSTVAAAPPAP